MSLFLWENTREEFVQLFLVFPPLSLYLTLRIPPYFFLENTTIPNLHEVKENMTMGTTLVTNPSGGFLVREGGEAPLCDADLHKGSTVNDPYQT